MKAIRQTCIIVKYTVFRICGSKIILHVRTDSSLEMLELYHVLSMLPHNPPLSQLALISLLRRCDTSFQALHLFAALSSSSNPCSPPFPVSITGLYVRCPFLTDFSTRQGDPWDVTPEQVREVTHSVKKLLPGILREEERGAGDGFGGTGGGGGGSAGGGGAGGGQKQGRGQEVSFWKIVLPSFIERCMSSTIVDLHALPFINNLLVVSIVLREASH